MSARVCVSLIRNSKEVKTAHKRTKNKTHKRPQARTFVCSVFVLRLRRVGFAVAVCYAMKEKMEMIRGYAEAILDELAEMEVLINEIPEVHPSGTDCTNSKRVNE